MGVSTLSEDQFRRVCSRFATGVAIAAVVDESGAPHGLTINSFTSVSLDPPLVLICISYHTPLLQRFLQASHFGLSFLKADQWEISDRFAMRVDDRFDGIPYQTGQFGAPLLSSCLASMECAMRQILDGGDHAILMAEVMAAETGGGDPLLFFDSSYQNMAR
ncbi:MAG: flavin reductase family protein [Bryobacterales bacterium]|nr:flavin reductase family protein [Bryobacterales bacterium]